MILYTQHVREGGGMTLLKIMGKVDVGVTYLLASLIEAE